VDIQGALRSVVVPAYNEEEVLPEFHKRISAATFIYAAMILYEALALRNPVRDYRSMMAGILFLVGVQLWSIGVNGEYLGRMLNETKQRPLYFVNNCMPAARARLA